MGLFSRRKRRKQEAEAAAEQEAVAESTPEVPEGKPERPEGPFDISERTPTESYIDLGSLKIPAIQGMSLNLEVEESSGTVVSAAVEHGESRVQLQAFAASKSGSLWDGISSEIDDAITQQGGRTDRRDGRFGPELLARVQATGPNGEQGHMVARFVGIDGPRWFLRAVFGGPAAINDEAAQELEAFVAGVIVDRGTGPMSPTELLPLRVPEGSETAAESAQAQHDAGANKDNHDPRRGPEITQVG
ncbi:DUF3710 domain-containing protein [Pseudoglutamicibacter cumminsii]|uniref:DUF3710 domain-containing protein n=1 Tax=Pseudoglutamicibacter cumminsii TaxID=156979 RepID=UPI001959B297|nr:DUF3710 domain-containing protein [Pseudoglutamicibacter cumminsii]MBM7795088.1 hypothetical protein [Pseudoglutamicibacter cumminsii]